MTPGPYTSPTVAAVFAALAKAQANFDAIRKDKDNPFYRSKFADLSSVIEAIRGSLSEAELCVWQSTEPDPEEEYGIVRTVIGHSSGEWIGCVYPVRPVPVVVDNKSGEKGITPQAIGSAITYARRYSLMALAGVAPEDDDGNAASGHHNQPVQQRAYRQQARPQRPPPQAGDDATPEQREQVSEAQRAQIEAEVTVVLAQIQQTAAPAALETLGAELSKRYPNGHPVRERTRAAYAARLADLRETT